MMTEFTGRAQPAELGERVQLSDPDITVRYESPEEISPSTWAPVVAMLERAFNFEPAWGQIDVDPVEHFRWKTAPARGNCVVELTEVGERVIGLKLQFRERFLVRQEVQLADVGNDDALDPDYQGRGLSRQRGDLRAEAMPLPKADFSLDRDTHPFYQKDYEADGSIVIANRVLRLTRPLSLRGMLAGRQVRSRGPSQTRERVARGSSRPAPVLSTIRRVPAGLRTLAALVRRDARDEPPGIRIESVSRFDERADEFWEDVAASFDLIQIRNREFLNWRYCDPRSGVTFVRSALSDEGLLLGFVAARRTPSAVMIADLLTRPGAELVAGALVAEVVAWARDQAAAKVHAWLPMTHPLRSAFGPGWIVRELPHPFVIKERERPMREYDFLRQPEARIHLVAGDTDHI